MTLQKNLLSKRLLLVPSTSGFVSKEAFNDFKGELFSYGFLLSADLKKSLRHINQESFDLFAKETLLNISKLFGSNQKYKTLKEDFLKDEDIAYRTDMFEKFKTLELATDTVLNNLMVSLLSSNISISPEDKEFLSLYMNDSASILDNIPDISFKEHIALLASIYSNSPKLFDILKRYVKTATDVLRLAFSFSGVEFPKKGSLKLTNKQRKIIAVLLNDIKNPLEDLKLYRREWLIVSKIIHIGSNKNKYPNAFLAIDKLRNNEKSIRTFNSLIEEQIKRISSTSNLDTVLKLLSSRPGIFARQLDFLLKKSKKHEEILNSFELISKEMSTSVLVSLKGFFQNRNVSSTRFFVPKGNVSKIFKEESVVLIPGLPEETYKRVNLIIDNALSFSYNKIEANNVYIDPSLKNILVPTSLRSSSKTMNLLTRGSRIPFVSDKTIRMFLWWENALIDNREHRTDVDLSAVGLDKDFNMVTYLDYTSLENLNSEHSGDFTDAPISEGGASEFIDINKEAFLNKGIKYVVMNVFVFSEQNFSELNCFAGIMSKDDPSVLFDVKTIKEKFTLSSETSACVPLIIDLEESCLIWSDFSMTSRHIHSVAGNRTSISNVCEYVSSMNKNKMSIYDLLKHHIDVNKTNIDEIYQNTDYDKVFDLEYFSSIENLISLV